MHSEAAEIMLCDIISKDSPPLSVSAPLISSPALPSYGQMPLQAQLGSVRRFL